MARKALNDAERARRDAAKAERLATRGTKPRKQTIEPAPAQAPAQIEPQMSTTPADTTPAPEKPATQSAATPPPLGEPAGAAPQSEPKTPAGGGSFSPLGGNRIRREYSTPKINPDLAHTPIPEVNPVIEQVTPENVNKFLNPSPATGPGMVQKPGAPAAGAPQAPAIIPPVEGFNQMAAEEQKQAAEQTADLILGAYDRLHWLGRKYVKVDMDDVDELHRKNEINKHAPFFENDEDPQHPVTIVQYFDDFNKQVEQEFTVKPQFIETVRPPLVRVCQKRGWGASDEVFLMFKFGEDIALKTGLLVGFKKLTNKHMEEFKEDHKNIQARVAAEQKRQELEAKRLKDAVEADAKRAAEGKGEPKANVA